MTELLMDRRVVWNHLRMKEVDEAKKEIMMFKRKGYPVLTSSGEPLERFNPNLEEVLIKATKLNLQVIKILTENGDDRITWDKDNGRQAKEAKSKFLEFIKKGYKAYSVDIEGQKNRPIEEFDVDAEEILMIPPTVKG